MTRAMLLFNALQAARGGRISVPRRRTVEKARF